MTRRIDCVQIATDWWGFYLDGVLYWEGHKIELEDLEGWIRELTVTHHIVNEHQLQEWGWKCPPNLHQAEDGEI